MKRIILASAVLVAISSSCFADGKITYSTPYISVHCVDGYKFAIIQTLNATNSHQILGEDGPATCGDRLAFKIVQQKQAAETQSSANQLVTEYLGRQGEAK